jgi:hypothetical protein
VRYRAQVPATRGEFDEPIPERQTRQPEFRAWSRRRRREGFFFGLREILTADPVDSSQFLALYNKYDSFPVDTNNALPGRA